MKYQKLAPLYKKAGNLPGLSSPFKDLWYSLVCHFVAIMRIQNLVHYKDL